MKLRISLGIVLLIVAAAGACEWLLLPQRERQQMMAEEIVLKQIWAVASPVCAVLGLLLVTWTPITNRLQKGRQ